MHPKKQRRRQYLLRFLFAGFCIVASSTFQALGHGMLSLVVSVVRQLLVLLPAAYILSVIGGLNAIWYSFLFAEVASLIVSTIFIRRVYNGQIKPMYADREGK